MRYTENELAVFLSASASPFLVLSRSRETWGQTGMPNMELTTIVPLGCLFTVKNGNETSWRFGGMGRSLHFSNQVVNTNLNTTYTIPWLFLRFSTLSGTTAPGNNTPHVLSLTMSIPGIYCLLALD